MASLNLIVIDDGQLHGPFSWSIHPFSCYTKTLVAHASCSSYEDAGRRSVFTFSVWWEMKSQRKNLLPLELGVGSINGIICDNCLLLVLRALCN